MVAYLTDNGWIQDPESDRPKRSKFIPYDAGHRTPIMIRWLGKIEPGRSPHLASAIDIAPTLLRIAGLPPAPDITGLISATPPPWPVGKPSSVPRSRTMPRTWTTPGAAFSTNGWFRATGG